MSTSFDYQGALNAGYTDDEIEPFLKEIHPNFDLNGAKQAGYSVKEINEFLSSYKPPDNRPVAQKAVEKIGRLATQGGRRAKTPKPRRDAEDDDRGQPTADVATAHRPQASIS